MIRRFEPKDEEQCIEIIRHCFDDSIILEPDAKDYIKRLFTTSGYLKSKMSKYDLFVYEEDSQILGMGAIDGNRIKKVYVDTKLHGKGIGKRILEFLESHAKAKGIKELVLCAYENSKGFYEKQGYKIVSSREIRGCQGESVKGIEMHKEFF